MDVSRNGKQPGMSKKEPSFRMTNVDLSRTDHTLFPINEINRDQATCQSSYAQRYQPGVALRKWVGSLTLALVVEDYSEPLERSPRVSARGPVLRVAEKQADALLWQGKRGGGVIPSDIGEYPTTIFLDEQEVVVAPEHHNKANDFNTNPFNMKSAQTEKMYDQQPTHILVPIPFSRLPLAGTLPLVQAVEALPVSTFATPLPCFQR